MKKIFTLNLILIFTFFLINIIFLKIEKHLSYSADEILGGIIWIVFIFTLILVDKNAFSKIHNFANRILARGLLITLTILLMWAIIFSFNWYIYYPSICVPAN